MASVNRSLGSQVAQTKGSIGAGRKHRALGACWILSFGDFGKWGDNLSHSSYRQISVNVLVQGKSTVWLLSSIVGLYSEQNVNIILCGQSVIDQEKNFGRSSYLTQFSIADTILARGLVCPISFNFSYSTLDWAMFTFTALPFTCSRQLAIARSRFVTCTQYNRDETLVSVSVLAASWMATNVGKRGSKYISYILLLYLGPWRDSACLYSAPPELNRKTLKRL